MTADDALRAELSRAAGCLPATTVGRAARAVLGELARRLGRLGDVEGDTEAWRRELDIGVSVDTLRRALRLVAAVTPLVERVGGRAATYACRAGRAQREHVRRGGALPVVEVARSAEPDWGQSGWQHPDVALALPWELERRALLGDSVREPWRPVSRRMRLALRRCGVVHPASLGQELAARILASLRGRWDLLARRRREIGLAPREQHADAYRSLVIAAGPQPRWLEEDRERAVAGAQRTAWRRERQQALRRLSESPRATRPATPLDRWVAGPARRREVGDRPERDAQGRWLRVRGLPAEAAVRRLVAGRRAA